MGIPIDFIKGVARFEMVLPVNDIGVLKIKHSWLIEQEC